MKKLKYFILVLLFAALWISCKKEINPYIDANAPAPKDVTDIKVTETPGGAIITYKRPTDSNLAYVKAEYEIQPGVFREAKASYYTDTLRLVGFGDTLSHKVKLYSVGKNEKKSEPVFMNVTPLIPPVQSVFKSLDLSATFAGIQVSFKNNSQSNLAIVVMADTTGQNTWSTVKTFYTGALEGKFSVRGFDTTEMKFAVILRDRWDNKSDTLIKSLTPLFEEFIPKNTWQALHLPTDSWKEYPTLPIEKLWDGSLNGYAGAFAQTLGLVLPNWFTIDLGKNVVMSRIVVHQLPDEHFYQGSAVKAFELWGSNDPDLNGGWAHWNLLGTFHSFKPSGLPMGQVTDEDRNYGWFIGENFEFDHALPAFRFIRFKTLETYGGSGSMVIQELDVYGKIQP